MVADTETNVASKKSIIVHSEYRDRVCPVCQSDDPELLYKLKDIMMGIQYAHELTEHIAVCKTCGFVFSSPCLSQAEFDDYYNDQDIYFNPEETYSIDARMSFLGKYLNKGDKVLEIGGNTQGFFRSRIECMGVSYDSFDINQRARNTLSDSSSSDDVYDILLSYYVMEHIVDLDKHIEQWSALLKDGGVFVIEVPNLWGYPQDISGLRWVEHVNHFSPYSLTAIMGKHGFDLMDVSFSEKSRDFGFAAAYKKVAVHDGNPNTNHYLGMGESDNLSAHIINRAIVCCGLHLIEQYYSNVKDSVEFIRNIVVNKGGCAVWCMNDIASRILNEYLIIYGDFNGILAIDEDAQKKKMSYQYEILSFNESFDRGYFDRYKELIIFSQSRVESIMRIIQESVVRFNRIYYTTREWTIKPVSESLDLYLYRQN